MPLATVDIFHDKQADPQLDGATPASAIRAADYNGAHKFDPVTVLSALGITLVIGNPNGTSGTAGALAWDRSNSQLWINTNGGTTWTAFVRSDGGTAPPLKAFLLWTDSNGMGAGTETDQDDPADNVTVPNTNVVLSKIYTTNFTEPVTPVNMGTGTLRIEGFNPAHGPELAIGRVLNDVINGSGSTPDSAHKLWLDQMSIHSSKLADWMQGSSAGTLSPLLGGGNLDADSNARAITMIAASSGQVACLFTMLGTNDASTSIDAGNVLTNVPAFIARKRAVLGPQLLFVWVVIQSTITNPPFPNAATARANQIAALAAATGTAAVYAEDIPTIDDFAHFTSIGEMVLGTRMAMAYVRLAGLRERVVAVPTVVGFSPATYNGSAHGLSGFTGVSGANIRAWPWQGSADGDVMFMPVFSGDFGGAPIPTPSGWTAAASQITTTDASTVNSRIALFTKQLAQAELDGNAASTGGPGFPISVTVAPGGVEFVTKPFTIRGSARFPAIVAIQSFAHGAFDTSAVTAAGVTTNGANRPVFILVMCRGSTGQSIAVVNANLTGLSQIFGASYPSSSGDFLHIALWQGTLAAQGASGNTTLMPAINANPAGFTWTM